MSAHNTLQELHKAEFEVADPGDGAAIAVDRWNMIIPLTIAASGTETNTLAAPLRAGQMLHIMAISVGGSGYRWITAASAVNQAGNTVMKFDAVDERIKLEAMPVGSGTCEWRVISYEGATFA